MSSSRESRSGLAYGLAAFGMWGLLPLYWALFESSSALEVLAHRMVWSLPVALAVLLLLGRWSWIRVLLREPRKLLMTALSSVFIALNWYLFIWAVEVGRVLEASLGYFINPLFTIAIGVLMLRERLRPWQWGAVGVGASAVLVMTVGYGQVPWLSLVLSSSFALYALLKKQTGLDGVEGFSADSAFQFLPALGVLGYLSVTGKSSFLTEGPLNAGLLLLTGLATALPLIAYGAAMMRVPLSTVGMLQYIAPASMFVLGLTVFDEEMPPSRLAGFLLIWLALAILTVDALRTARRNRRRLRAARLAAAGTAVGAGTAYASEERGADAEVRVPTAQEGAARTEP